ncbi:MAG: metallophosphoesterase family protein [Ruminococcaceae bacterium]|nr:metallophosphoesterase family protein [Oscillospiraceae bacterium]
MKLLILSDIHANHLAPEAIFEKESDADAIYCAGDLVDYGPFPHEVIAWMRAHKVRAVYGNHDRELLDTFREMGRDFSHIPPSEYLWKYENCLRMTDEDIEYLTALPETLDFSADGYRYRMAHQSQAHWQPPRSTTEFDAFAAGTAGPAEYPVRLILGHTHRQSVYTMAGDRVWINPGSTYYRQPDDYDKSAQYAVVEDGEISLRSVVYDRSPLRAEVLSFAEKNAMKAWEITSAMFATGD